MDEIENKEILAEKTQEGFDIDFDDDVDINEEKENQLTTSDEPSEITSESLAPLMALNEQIEQGGLKHKKYVIYIDSDNIDFMENLSISERKHLINDILTNQIKVSEKERFKQRNKKLITHLLTVCFSAIIFLPLAFFIVNKTIELTIVNYVQAEQNFEKLYRTHGKLKMKENVYKNLK